MRRPLALQALCMLGLASVTAHLAYAQLDPLPYMHGEADRRLVLRGLEAPKSECLTLTQDTILHDDAACIYVGDSVTLNLGGHTVLGDVVGFESGRDITIKNGVVAEGAIVLLGSHNVLRRIVVRDSDTTFAVQIGGGLISHSVFERNTVAVDLFFGGGVEVRHSVFHRNDIGVNIASDNNSRVRFSVFQENGTGVRIVDEDLGGASESMISQNGFYANGIGVFLDARSEANHNRIRSNWFASNTSSAIVVRLACERLLSEQCAGRGAQLYDNRLIHNGGQAQALSGEWMLATGASQPYEVMLNDGITVVALPETGVAEGVTITRNIALFNADLGIDAPGVIDGGRNHAMNNGNPAQCVGVTCNLFGSPGQSMSRH